MLRSSPKGKTSPYSLATITKTTAITGLIREIIWTWIHKHCMNHLNPMSPYMNDIIIKNATRRKP